MKKIISIFLIAVMLCVCYSNIVFANENTNINVYVDGKLLTFDVQPQLINDRTMVPLRAIFEALGATVDWNNNTETVTATNSKYTVKATIGSKIMIVNGIEKTMDIAPMMLNNRTLVPARFVAEAFDCDVNWNNDTSTVNITSNSIKQMFKNKNTSTIQKPYSADSNEEIIYQRNVIEPIRKIKVSCTNVLRGAEANSLLASEHSFNSTGVPGCEWFFIELNVEFISSSAGRNDILHIDELIYPNAFYTYKEENFSIGDIAKLGDKYGEYDIYNVKLYPGTSSKVAIGLLIDKELFDLKGGDILLKIPNISDNDDSWIKCYPKDYSNNSSVNNTQSSNTNTYNETTAIEYYPGTDIPTYTSVTGVPLKDIRDDKVGNTYRYDYTKIGEYSEFVDYIVYLNRNGWLNFSEENDGNMLIYAFTKDLTNDVVVGYIASTNEVWISIITTD